MGRMTDHPDQSGSSKETAKDDVDSCDERSAAALANDTGCSETAPKQDADAFEASSLSDQSHRVAAIGQTLSYNSPIPPPQVMQAYEEAQPGAFNRILQLTEKEQDHRISEREREGTHRREVVERDQEAGITDQKRGMYLGVLVVLIMVVGVVGCAAFDQPWPAGILGGGLTGIIGIFAWRQRRGNSDDQPKP